MVLARKDGINHWKRVLGPPKVRQALQEAPNSVRALFGDPELKAAWKNACHGSIDPSSAEREIEIIFPHIFADETQQNDTKNGGHRPQTSDSAIINGHTIPIREKQSFIEGDPEMAEVEESKYRTVFFLLQITRSFFFYFF